MSDPFANLKTLDAAGLKDAAEMAGGLCEPFDDVPDFDGDNPEVDTVIRLSGDRSLLRRPTRRLYVDYRPDPAALLHLAKFPAEGETLAGVISGRYAAWDIIPAMIDRVGRRIDDLHIATLSYGKQNAADLLGLLDDGRIRRVSLLVSYYFKAQNRPLYDTLVPPLRERGHRVLAMRTHAKLTLMKFAGGGSYVWEGSANLRSSKNVEQFSLTRCRRLYKFHRDWLDGELLNTREEGDPDEAAEG